MAKRSKLEIIRDILYIILDNNKSIKLTPLLRKSNLSSTRFYEYYNELMTKDFIVEIKDDKGKLVKITDKGKRFLDKYRTIIDFIDEFEL